MNEWEQVLDKTTGRGLAKQSWREENKGGRVEGEVGRGYACYITSLRIRK